jgi:[ribosomal protein S18]-alanine N-acetyltransferase
MPRCSGKDPPTVCHEANPKEGFLIRAFREEDAAEVSEILSEAPEASGWSVEVTRATFLVGGVSGFVSENGGSLTGFILGRQVGDEGEILNLAVARKNRRLGAGTALAKAMLSAFEGRGVWRVFLEVRESNSVATVFYTRLGFRQVGRREGYYHGPSEAALILEHNTKNPQVGTE